MRGNLEFRGNWTTLFGAILLATLLTIFTLGIGTPWAYAYLRRTVLSNTYYQGRALQFDGTGGQVLGQYLIIFLLTLITLGFYAFLGFASVRILRWDAEHTILPNGKRLEYRGTGLDLLGELLLIYILSALTLGIYFFWGYARLRRHILTHTTVDGRPLQFTGTGGQYFGVAFVNLLLTTITLGLYSLLGFASVRELRWDAENTILPEMPEATAAPPNAPAGGRPIQVTVNVNQ